MFGELGFRERQAELGAQPIYARLPLLFRVDNEDNDPCPAKNIDRSLSKRAQRYLVSAFARRPRNADRIGDLPLAMLHQSCARPHQGFKPCRSTCIRGAKSAPGDLEPIPHELLCGFVDKDGASSFIDRDSANGHLLKRVEGTFGARVMQGDGQIGRTGQMAGKPAQPLAVGLIERALPL
jgi:hypothetical protein